MKKIALYNPFLDVLGGGERHILSILKVLEEAGYKPYIFWNEDISGHISSQLNISFADLNFLPELKDKSAIEKVTLLNQFDIFLYVTNGSYFFSSAKNNFIFAMVPQQTLYQMSPLNKLKTKNYTFISNSKYTQEQLQNWGISSKVIYPYISDEILNISLESLNKEKIILSVGRFFSHLHSKRQDVAIEWFLELQESYKEFQDYKLVLVGSLKDEDRDYFNKLKFLSQKNTKIEFYPNISFETLIEWYKKSRFYWHMAGINVDVVKHPENVEHLGITPLEAMAAGCITMAYDAGGPKEIINHNKTGFLYKNQDELFTSMNNIVADQKKQKVIKQNAKKYVINNFSYDIFKEKVKKIFL